MSFFNIHFFQSSFIHRRSIPPRSWHLQRDRYQKRSSQMEIFHFSKNHFFSRPKPLPHGVHNIKLYCSFSNFYVCQINKLIRERVVLYSASAPKLQPKMNMKILARDHITLNYPLQNFTLPFLSGTNSLQTSRTEIQDLAHILWMRKKSWKLQKKKKHYRK